MERSEIRGTANDAPTPDYAALHPGYKIGPTSASPFNNFGISPVRPAAWRMKKFFSGGVRSTMPRPMSRNVRSKRRLVREQEVQRVGGNAHRHGVETAPALVALEHVGAAEIHAEPCGIDHDLGQCGDILQPHVEALAGDGVNDVGGIADQREALGDEGARHEIGQRERARLVERLDLAEMQTKTLLELAVKFFFAQRNDARGLCCGARSTPATIACRSAAGSQTDPRARSALRHGPRDRARGRP